MPRPEKMPKNTELSSGEGLTAGREHGRDVCVLAGPELEGLGSLAFETTGEILKDVQGALDAKLDEVGEKLGEELGGALQEASDKLGEEVGGALKGLLKKD